MTDEPRRATTDEGGDPACWAQFDERPLNLTEASLAALVRGLADAVVIADRAGTIRLWNGAAEHLFGWTASEALGQPLTMIIPERLRSRHTSGYERVMATGTTSYADRLLQVPALHRDGRGMSIAFTVSLVFDDLRTPAGVAAVIRDDTANWQLRQDARKQSTAPAE